MGIKIIIDVSQPMPIATIFDNEKQVLKSPLRVDLADDIAKQPLPNGDYSYQDRKTWENRVKNKVLKALQKTLTHSRYAQGVVQLVGLQEVKREDEVS